MPSASSNLWTPSSGSSVMIEPIGFAAGSGIQDVRARKVELASSVQVQTGSGSPEGATTAVVGSLYLRADGGTGTTLYVKESGSSNTGWTAVASGGGGTNYWSRSGTVISPATSGDTVQVGDGTKTAPAYSFTGETGFGFYRAAAGQIILASPSANNSTFFGIYPQKSDPNGTTALCIYAQDNGSGTAIRGTILYALPSTYSSGAFYRASTGYLLTDGNMSGGLVVGTSGSVNLPMYFGTDDEVNVKLFSNNIYYRSDMVVGWTNTTSSGLFGSVSNDTALARDAAGVIGVYGSGSTYGKLRLGSNVQLAGDTGTAGVIDVTNAAATNLGSLYIDGLYMGTTPNTPTSGAYCAFGRGSAVGRGAVYEKDFTTPAIFESSTVYANVSAGRSGFIIATTAGVAQWTSYYWGTTWRMNDAVTGVDRIGVTQGNSGSFILAKSCGIGWDNNGNTIPQNPSLDTQFKRDSAGVIGVYASGTTYGRMAFAASVTVSGGTGSPEGAVTAAVGSLFMRSDGGTGTAVYMKESGTGNTGWTPVGTSTNYWARTGTTVYPATTGDHVEVRTGPGTQGYTHAATDGTAQFCTYYWGTTWRVNDLVNNLDRFGIMQGSSGSFVLAQTCNIGWDTGAGNTIQQNPSLDTQIKRDAAGVVGVYGSGSTYGTVRASKIGMGGAITPGSAGQIQWNTGLGAITHLLGPTDQPLKIAAGAASGAGVGITIVAGASGTNTLDGGIATITGGAGLTSGNGGAASLTGGAGGSTGSGGTAFLLGGNGGSGGAAGNGGAVQIAGGYSGGSSLRGGNISIITYESTSSTSQARHFIPSNRTALTDATETTFATFSMPTNDRVATVTVFYTVRAMDAADFQVESGWFTVVAINDAGTVTVNAAPTKYGNDQKVTAGTLTVTPAVTVSGTTVNIRITSDTSLTTTTHDIVAQYFSNSVLSIIPS